MYICICICIGIGIGIRIGLARYMYMYMLYVPRGPSTPKIGIGFLFNADFTNQRRIPTPIW